MIIGAAFLVGYLVANPGGTVWQAKYWLGMGDRASSLVKLVASESNGAESELSHAIASEDEALRICAAEALAARGDKRGIETLVALCAGDEAGESVSRGKLEGLLNKPDRLEDFDSVQAWYDSTRHTLQCDQHAVWREEAR